MKKRINNFRLFESFNYGTWISCEEQLPENGEQVLVYRPNPSHRVSTKLGNPKSNIFVAEFEQIEDRFRSNPNNEKPYTWHNLPSSYFGQEITHWMPLPVKP
jgi:hypothetical protein